MNKYIKRLCVTLSIIIAISCIFQLDVNAVNFCTRSTDDIYYNDLLFEFPTETVMILPTDYSTECSTDKPEETLPATSQSETQPVTEYQEYSTDPVETFSDPTEVSDTTPTYDISAVNTVPYTEEVLLTEAPWVSTQATQPWAPPTESPTQKLPTEPTEGIAVNPTVSIVTPQLIVIPKTTISLASSKGNVYVKGTKQIRATVKNGRGSTTYKSLNLSVAEVSSTGLITGVKKGKAVIIVKNNGTAVHYTITVNNPELNITSKVIKKGKTFSLSVIGKVGTPKFSSTNQKIAKVSSKGKVKGLKKGNCSIKVKTNGMTLKCKVKVKNKYS